jgi:hypothetical protein
MRQGKGKRNKEKTESSGMRSGVFLFPSGLPVARVDKGGVLC